MMKKYLLISCQVVVLISALFILTSFGDDEDGPSGHPLEGTLWGQVSFEFAYGSSLNSNESSTLVCTDQNYTTVLFENGTITYY